jgi:hypothetical protein
MAFVLVVRQSVCVIALFELGANRSRQRSKFTSPWASADWGALGSPLGRAGFSDYYACTPRLLRENSIIVWAEFNPADD